MNRLSQLAYELADDLHAGQVRKYNHAPYITHPERVAVMVSQHRDATENWIAAAYLHDVLEDTDCTVDCLFATFPEEVVTIVKDLTAPKVKGNRATRKAAYNHQLLNASRAAKIIKMYDRLDNLRDMPETESFRIKYAWETLALLSVVGPADGALAQIVGSLVKSILGDQYNE